jgi:hypothetical protein
MYNLIRKGVLFVNRYEPLYTLDKFKEHRFIDADGKHRVIYALNLDSMKKFIKLIGSARRNLEIWGMLTISRKRYERAFKQAAVEIHKNMNFHEYGQKMSETKYLSRICFYWLKQKPISVLDESRVYYDPATINELIVVSVIMDYIFTIVDRSLLDGGKYWFGITDEMGRYDRYRILMNEEAIASVEYFLSNYSTTIHLIELYAEGMLAFAKSFIDYG